MRLSTRINGVVSSINVKDSIAALYCVLLGDGKNPQHVMLDVCHDLTTSWKGDSAKGLSSFVTDGLVERMLDEDLLTEYKTIHSMLAKL